MSAAVPTLIPEPFANQADPANINVIPDTTADNQTASWALGFPPKTLQPEIAGGKPPFGQDVNGALFAISSHTFYQQTGGAYPYNATLATSIGGYGTGTILRMADGTGFWECTANNNLTDPDAGGAGWLAMGSFGFAAVPGVTGAALVTLTVAQWKKKVIVVSGVLTANATIVFPNTLQEWLIVNNCTGAFALTVATQFGAGVGCAPGGFSAPTGVYGDGTNLYLSTTPLNIPISQAANPLTLAQRTNLGYLFATYFNTEAVPENPAIGNVMFQNTTGDGFIRNMTLANFLAQIFTDANLSGHPSAPTPPVNDSTGLLATTAFANPGVTVNANGTAIRLPSGYLIQFGSCNPAGGTVPVTFPVPFPTAAPGFISANGTSFPTTCNAHGATQNSMSVTNSGGSAFWIAIGK